MQGAKVALQMSDASVSCKVGARYWTLVVSNKLFYIIFGLLSPLLLQILTLTVILEIEGVGH